MRDDVLDDLFDNLDVDSPVAAEMKALVDRGLPVDDGVLERSVDAVMTRVRPARSWKRWAVVGGLAAASVAAAMGVAGVFAAPEGPPEEVPAAAVPEPSPGGRAARVGPRHPPDHPKHDVVEPIPEYDTESVTLSVQDHLTLGEQAFDEGNADLAYEHYLAVVEGEPDHPMAPFALYKLAWTEFNLGDLEAAADDMALVLDWTEGYDDRMSQTVHEAALDDLERFEAELDEEF